MANYEEKRIVWELDRAYKILTPLTGFGGGPTVTAGEIASSWLDHEPLYQKLGFIIYNYNSYINCIDYEEKKYFLEVIDETFDKFWEENSEVFKDVRKRVKYEDWLKED